MAPQPLAILIAVAGLLGLIVPFVALTILSLRREEHSPKALRDAS